MGDFLGADQAISGEQGVPEEGPTATSDERRGGLSRLSGRLRRQDRAQAARELEASLTAIRQATWTRSVNVLVASPKGGVGRTTTTLVLAGSLGSARGGYVAALEATEDQGDLADRAEGVQARGLTELLADPVAAQTAGGMGSFTAPQSSHVEVIASSGPRPELSAADVVRLRAVVDHHYRVTVTDSGANQHSSAFQGAAATADAVVIPTTSSPAAVAGVSRTLMHLVQAGRADLLGRVVVVLTHDGGWEDKDAVAGLPAQLEGLGVRHVVDVPFDHHLRAGAQITYSDLTESSRRAWVHAAAAVVDVLADAPATAPVVTASIIPAT